MSTLQARNGYDGLQGYDAQRQGQATFKVQKKEKPPKSKSIGAKKENSSKEHKKLSSDEIKLICTEKGLTRGDVYQIRSSFVSMCSLSDSYLVEQGIKKDAMLEA